ncbi:MAG: NADPH-dependent FMN reductase [Candidatus Kapaibacterium sp.]
MVKILVFAASLREESLNRKLATVAARYAEEEGAEVQHVHFQELAPPLYNGDAQQKIGFPVETEKFVQYLEEADGLILASPEYNYSLPGTLKNAIDWVSRVRPMPLRGKSALLISTSTGQIGGIRGLWQLRIPLEGLGVYVHPDMYALPWGGKMFDEEGYLVEEERGELLQKMVRSFISFTERIASSR